MPIARTGNTKHALLRQGVLDHVGVRAQTPELDDAAIADIDMCLARALAATEGGGGQKVLMGTLR
ncbi:MULTISPECIES: hypothetical protein [unclassified Sinorhizobium]|uniref:hypothetical protein n=1 Tax=unclassified Sinorhizobium TaxID=2613772 RepID=UPI003524E59C